MKSLARTATALLLAVLLVSCGQTPVPTPTVAIALVDTARPTEVAPTRVPDTAVPTVAPTTAPDTAAPPTAEPTTAQPTERPTRRPTNTRPPATEAPTLEPPVDVTPTGDQVLLQLNLQEGQVLGLRTTAKQVISETVMGMTIMMTQTIGMGYSYDVQEVDAARGTTWVKVTYDWVLYKIQSEFVTIEYDSDNPPDPMPAEAQVFEALVGANFRMNVDRFGRILETEGVDDMVQTMLDNMGLPAGPTRDQAEQQLAEQYGDEAMKGQMENNLVRYPLHPVAVGDSWSHTSTVPGQMPMSKEDTWTLRDRQGGICTIAVESAISPPEDNAPVMSGGIEIIFELSGRQWGSVEVDEATGWVQNGLVHQNISGTIRSTDESVGMSGRISINGTILFEAYEK